MTKDEFLKSIGKTEEQLKAEGKEVVKFNDADPDCPGWDVLYIDKDEVEILMGCKCSDIGSIHDKL